MTPGVWIDHGVDLSQASDVLRRKQMLLTTLYNEPLIPSIGAQLMRCDWLRRNVDPHFDRNAISSAHGNLRALVASTFSLVEPSEVGIVNFVKHAPNVMAVAWRHGCFT